MYKFNFFFFNSLRLGDAYECLWFGSSVVQVKVFSASSIPNLYLKQWFVASGQLNFKEQTSVKYKSNTSFFHENLEDIVCEIWAIFPWGQCVKCWQEVISEALMLTHCGLMTVYGIMDGSALDQIMACYLMAQGHYLKQCWLRVNYTCRSIFH